MSWSTLDADDVKARVAGPLFDSVKSAGLSADQTDPWPELLITAIDFARGSIASHTANKLGSGDTVPTAAVRHTITIAVWDGVSRFAHLKHLVTDSLKEDFKAANRYFERVAEGKQSIELPDTVDESTEMPVETGGFQVVDVEESPRRRATRRRMDGL